MNDQSQNNLYPQPAGNGVEQPTGLPQAGLGAQGQSDTQSLLLGNGFDTASLLNQTQVLGTSSTTQEADTTPAAAKATSSRGHVPIMVITVALVVMIIVALLFRMIDSNRENS